MKFSSGDALSVVEIMRDVARTEILPSWRNLSPGAIRFKTSIHDIVTDADEAAETAITAMLRARFPGATVVGEEATAANPALLDRLAEAELAFIVDPIDGTKNFSAGLPLFGVIIGVAHRGEVIAGFILDPIGNDVAIGLRGRAPGSRRSMAGETIFAWRKPRPCTTWSAASPGTSWSSRSRPPC